MLSRGSVYHVEEDREEGYSLHGGPENTHSRKWSGIMLLERLFLDQKLPSAGLHCLGFPQLPKTAPPTGNSAMKL